MHAVHKMKKAFENDYNLYIIMANYEIVWWSIESSYKEVNYLLNFLQVVKKTNVCLVSLKNLNPVLKNSQK